MGSEFSTVILLFTIIAEYTVFMLLTYTPPPSFDITSPNTVIELLYDAILPSTLIPYLDDVIFPPTYIALEV